MVREPGRWAHRRGGEAWVRRTDPRDPRGKTEDERVGPRAGRARSERLRPARTEPVDGVHGTAQRQRDARPFARAWGPKQGDRAPESRATRGARSPTRVDPSRPQSHQAAPRDRAGARVATHGERSEVQRRVATYRLNASGAAALAAELDALRKVTTTAARRLAVR